MEQIRPFGYKLLINCSNRCHCPIIHYSYYTPLASICQPTPFFDKISAFVLCNPPKTEWDFCIFPQIINFRGGLPAQKTSDAHASEVSYLVMLSPWKKSVGATDSKWLTHFERLFRGAGGYPSTSAKADPTPSEYSQSADGCDAGEGEHEQRGGLCFGGACPQNKMESHDHGNAEKQRGNMLGSEGAPGHDIISFPWEIVVSSIAYPREVGKREEKRHPTGVFGEKLTLLCKSYGAE